MACGALDLRIPGKQRCMYTKVSMLGIWYFLAYELLQLNFNFRTYKCPWSLVLLVRVAMATAGNDFDGHLPCMVVSL